jgi:hypothetical protein
VEPAATENVTKVRAVVTALSARLAVQRRPIALLVPVATNAAPVRRTQSALPAPTELLGPKGPGALRGPNARHGLHADLASSMPTTPHDLKVLIAALVPIAGPVQNVADVPSAAADPVVPDVPSARVVPCSLQ